MSELFYYKFCWDFFYLYQVWFFVISVDTILSTIIHLTSYLQFFVDLLLLLVWSVSGKIYYFISLNYGLHCELQPLQFNNNRLDWCTNGLNERTEFKFVSLVVYHFIQFEFIMYVCMYVSLTEHLCITMRSTILVYHSELR